jgi:hypothetical protein
VLVLLAAVATAVWVTYARLPASELYNVSGSGFWAGAGRVLVFLDFPAALVGAALAVLAADRLAGRTAAATALVAVALCAVVFWPGVVDQSDLDAKPVNAFPAAGVGLAAVLAVTPGRARRIRGNGYDAVRIVLGAALALAAVPWVAADLGLSLDGTPVLGTLYQTGELRHEPGVPGLHVAVHRGHHHGLDGVLLALAALLLSRRLRAMSSPPLRVAVSAYLSLMLAYGVANALQDFWLEQVVKRGWTGTTIPGVLRPELTWGWAAIAAGALAVWLGWFRRERPD